MIDWTGLPGAQDGPPPRACVRVERPEAGLVILILDPPHRTSLPVLDVPLLRDLEAALLDVENDASVRGLVITGRDTRTFAAGADIDALGSLRDEEDARRVIAAGQDVYQRLADLSSTRERFTSVAAIGGAAAGGACELGLACDRIVLVDSAHTRIGLPETQLGILPAWGGTTRLPRRIGLPRALEAILTGRLFTPREAKRNGLVDRLCAPEDLLRVASDLAMRRTHVARPSRGIWRWLVDRNPLAAGIVAHRARETVLARTRGHYPAPLAAIEIASHAPRRSIEASLEAERAVTPALAVGTIAKNLIRLFKLGEEAKKLRFMADGTSAAAPATAGVLGAGVMGRAIASSLAERGIATRLYDTVGAALDTALVEHRRDVKQKLQRRRIERHEALAQGDRLDVARALEGFARCEIVIEAVAEKLEVKRALFAQLAQQVAPDAILASNTSSLSIDEIARDVPHPERVVGLHFFNPVKKMPLVEVVRGARTDPRVVARVCALATKLGKTPVVTSDVAGFLVNRLLGPYLDESLRMFAGGVDPARLERALRDFGMPMGPLELLDEVGFDIAAHAATSLHAAYGERMAPCSVLQAFIAEKRLGKKTGLGFYRHPATRKRGAAARLADDLARFVPTGMLQTGELDERAIAERALFAMLAEAIRALEEQVVAGPRELDLATVYGMGFPPFRGGLLRWADQVGAAEIVTRLEAIARMPDVAARPGGQARFAPPARLLELARTGRGFHG